MEYPKEEINKVKRGAKKAAYDRDTIYSILDATEICHVAFENDGLPMVQPINFGRDGDYLYLHGSLQNRMTSTIIEAGRVCVEVTLLDAMKLTKSAFHHSVNFRSVVIFGKTRSLESNEEKTHGLKAIINHFVPNRWEHCRPPNEKELKATRVVEIEIETASAKVATAPPTENKEDLPLDYWSGTIPVKNVLGVPIQNDFEGNKQVPLPAHIKDLLESKR
jgi:nitroimidazol reductase NimA-like FMN-containing flavoprotein (pyridoxamine 5'-phosphate oxidase superfamily)